VSAQANLIGTGYTCPFCRQTFQQADALIIGEAKEARVMRLAGQLAGHLSQTHKDEFGKIGATAGQIAGWLYTAPFKHNDADLKFFHEMTRLQLRAITKRVQISDEQIAQTVETQLHFKESLGKMWPPEAIEELNALVCKLLIGMRDALEEVPPPPTPVRP
jgi:hypothetical protein